LSAEIGIDLGTATTIVYVKGKGIVALEPSIVALNKHDENYFKIGTEAYKMLGRTPNHIELIRPLEEGVISNFKIALRLLRHYIKKYSTSFSQPKIMICVPSQVNDIEKRAVIDAAMQAGAGKVYLIEEPVAAALGSGIDITKPSGNLIVDIGGGTTDIAVIANKGSVLSSTINIASSKFDETIITHIKRKYKVLIGPRTAEDIKIAIGGVMPVDQNLKKIVTGRDLVTGLPKVIEISTVEIMEILRPKAIEIAETVKTIIEKTPPEMLEGIKTKGIYMTGGGSLLYGMDKLIEEYTKINTKIAEEPVLCVAYGAGKAIDDLKSIIQ
jgi:cell division protein ftsA